MALAGLSQLQEFWRVLTKSPQANWFHWQSSSWLIATEQIMVAVEDGHTMLWITSPATAPAPRLPTLTMPVEGRALRVHALWAFRWVQ